MKILMVGLGSIGQRHVRNLRKLLGDEVEFIAYRVRGLQRTFSATMQVREGINLEEEYGIVRYSSLEEALAQKPEVAFITNVTAAHMQCAIACAKAGCHLLIEKPLSDSMEGVDELKCLMEEKGIKIFMGFQNRYHPGVSRIRTWLEEGKIGEVVSAETEFCERLTTMHRYEDYSTTYMARKDLGGGPVLNLMVHDLDLLEWMFGKPRQIRAAGGKYSDLKLTVEDHAVIMYKGEYEGKPVTVTARTDFLQYPPSHRLKIVGTGGRMELDFNRPCAVLYEGDEPEVYEEYTDFLRDDMFLREEKDFLECIGTDSEPAISLNDGIDTLSTALEAIKVIREGMGSEGF